MHLIPFSPTLTSQIKIAAFRRFKDSQHWVKRSYTSGLEQFEQELSEKYHLQARPETVQKTLISRKKKGPVALSSVTVLNYVVLVSYLLGAPTLPVIDKSKILIDLLVELQKELPEGIDSGLIDEQLLQWGYSTKEFTNIYQLHYLNGTRKHGEAIFRVDQDWSEAELIFGENDRKVFKGTVFRQNKGNAIAVILKEPANNDHVFLTLVTDSNFDKLDGFYCSAAKNSEGSRVIAVRKRTGIKVAPEFDPIAYLKDTLIGVPEVSKEVALLAEDYLMYRLDSKKDRINCYQLTIEKSGAFRYQMMHSGKPSVYDGQASFINNCLALAVQLKDGEFYPALYIYYVGRPGASVAFLSGVYAAVAYDNAPIAGRVIFTADNRENKGNITDPYRIDSEAFLNTEGEVGQILRFLQGTENNQIKSSLKKRLKRSVNYKEILFLYACDANTINKLKYLKLALDQGYSDVARLKREVDKGALWSITESVEIHPPEKGIIKVELKIDDPPFIYLFSEK